ncbi:MAG TPA: hypothetical protein VLH40_01860 [Atribacteraceae bacterium]|nr:hypothetical protein [Atribacteraceae bacterium]
MHTAPDENTTPVNSRPHSPRDTLGLQMLSGFERQDFDCGGGPIDRYWWAAQSIIPINLVERLRRC